MKIIAINAAPRMEAGNTQMILNPFLIGARDQGAQIDLALLGRKTIEPCIGCFTCYAKTPGVCIHDDMMPSLIERIRRADMLVLATPVYLDGMTNLAKICIDRFVPFLDPHFEEDGEGLRHPLRWDFPKKLFLVSVCGYPGLHNFDPLVMHVKRIARNLHSDYIGSILRPAVFSILMKPKYPDRVRAVLDAVRLSGEELVRYGAVSQFTQAKVAADICSIKELKEAANTYWDRQLDTYGDEPA